MSEQNDEKLNPATLEFAEDDPTAAKRFKYFQHNDPFPTIRPALLNSADIYDYVRATGMIWPFNTKVEVLNEKLKGASYEIDFLGDVYLAPDDAIKTRKTVNIQRNDTIETRKVVKIKRDTVFPLAKNSIAFVYLETTFRLPSYIALRFNLRITHVHRGLLLGTGPLVDPGFIGRLLIPLHNLTSKNYTLIGGEGLIWVEFTKLSPYIGDDELLRNSHRPLFSIPARKIEFDAQKYFNRASEGVPAGSSIPGEVKQARDTAERIEEKVNKYTWVAWGAILAGALTVIGLVGSTWSLISDANKNVADSSKNISDFRKTVDDLDKDVDRLRAQVKSLQEQAKSRKQ